jgi:hypothetical protein
VVSGKHVDEIFSLAFRKLIHDTWGRGEVVVEKRKALSSAFRATSKCKLFQNLRLLVRRYSCSLLFLSAVFLAEWRTILGKSSCCEEKYRPLNICDADITLHLPPQVTLSHFCTNVPLLNGQGAAISPCILLDNF